MCPTSQALRCDYCIQVHCDGDVQTIYHAALLPGTVCFLDDILISGRYTEEHLRNVEAVLQRLQERGFKVNREKCAFIQTSVMYLGHRIDEQGIHPVQKKTGAIAKAPVPKRLTELRAYLVLLTYYGKFIENLSTLIKPMTELLQKDKKWMWSEQCQQAFERTKAQLSSSSVLVHYDLHLPVIQ